MSPEIDVLETGIGIHSMLGSHYDFECLWLNMVLKKSTS